MVKGKKILFSPLNWGLGHATRLAPFIRYCITRNADVVICASGLPEAWLRKEFPEAQFYTEPEKAITYGSNKFYTGLKLFFALPGLISLYFRERKTCALLVRKYQPDLIVSDNRYGFYHKDVTSVIITHQLNGRHIPLSYIWDKLLHVFLKPFQQIWVPDYKEKPKLSGQLCLKEDNRIVFTGPVSRLNRQTNAVKTCDLIVVLSGPEPQRTIFENQVAAIISRLNLKETILVRGTLAVEGKEFLNCFRKVYDQADTHLLQSLLNNSRRVIARSGYSSIMDLHITGTPCLVVPTPGQYEQEYLGAWIKKHGGFVMTQSALNDFGNSDLDSFVPLFPQQNIRTADFSELFSDALRQKNH